MPYMCVKRKIQFLLLILTLVFIWGHSCMPIQKSAAESGLVTQLLSPLLEVFVGTGNVTDHLVRKLAHFAEFAALGVQLLLIREKQTHVDIARSVEYGFFAAFLDESIQLLSGRGAQIRDVWLDTAGVVFGVVMVYIIKIARTLLRQRSR